MKVTTTTTIGPFSSPILDRCELKLNYCTTWELLGDLISEIMMYPAIDIEITRDNPYDIVRIRIQDGEFCLQYNIAQGLLDRM